MRARVSREAPTFAEFARKPAPRPWATVMAAPAVEHQPAPAADAPMLADSFGRFHDYLRISVTERCNFRCTYCMPTEGVDLTPQQALLTSDEIVRLARLFVGAGARKIRLTGGEPLVRRDIVDLAARLSALDGVRSLGITTNGLLLERRLSGLVAAGLTHVNVSLDSLLPDRFQAIARNQPAHALARVRGAIEAAVAELAPHGTGRVKVNCVVMRGMNDDELGAFVNLTESLPLDVRFIEWMPFDANEWNRERFMPYDEMRARAAEQAGVSLSPLATTADDTTKWWRASGHAGRVGFISSMSDHFCAGCTRLRITADGDLKTCLFGAEGAGSLSLRDTLRHGGAEGGGATDDELSRAIGAAVRRKAWAHGGAASVDELAATSDQNRPMTTIGG